MKRRDAIVSLVAAVCVVLALLTVFAIELANTQAKSKQDVEHRVQDRAVLAKALIDSLFGSVFQNAKQYQQLYGAPTVTPAALHHAVNKTTPYAALLDSSGNVLAATSGYNAQARADLTASRALAQIRISPSSPVGYGLGNLEPYGKSAVLDFAIEFPTRSGQRILVTPFAPLALGAFLTGDLTKIPGVRGAHNYVLDGTDTVLASNPGAQPAGYRFSSPAQIAALRLASGDRNGHYYVVVPLANATWKIVLASPDGPLFASVSGIHKWVPWIIFCAFALVALLALALARRVLRASDIVRNANAQLELVNGELATTNDALERRAAELARSNSELEQFASIASHDLQEPLRKVRTFTQQLTVIDGDRLSDKGRDYLERANTAAERMQKLIEDLLRFSRVATHGRPFVPVDLELVARDVLGDLEAQIERSGAVIELGELPTISADPLQMRQLIQNLLSNAIKFRRPGVAPEVRVTAEIDGEQLRLAVSDNGIGFEPQYSRRIFRVFERLHGRTEYPGTGIGLALVRKIAERHGGTVIADSEPGVGSTFTTILPLHQAEEVIVAQSAIDEEHDHAREAAHAPA